MDSIQNYYPLNHLKVSQEAVEKQEEAILNYLSKNNYIHLSERLSRISKIELRYTRESFEAEIDKVNRQLSEFMAFQEALFNLMTAGKIIPVRVSNYSSAHLDGLGRIHISYEERQSMMTSSGVTEISMPILVHGTFMLKPSLKQQ